MILSSKGTEKVFNTISKSVIWFLLFLLVTYFLFFTNLVSLSWLPCTTTSQLLMKKLNHVSIPNPSLDENIVQEDILIHQKHEIDGETGLKHVVFGIAASAKLWEHRKNYIKLWWRPNEMRGFVWLDKKVKTQGNETDFLPPLKISANIKSFPYKNRLGDPSAIRISRIISETVRLGLKDVRWLVMGDDDTMFVADNLVRVLQKYDHNEFYYIGSTSETHRQNIDFSYGMAYGGGGFAVSYGLAKEIEKMQDRCIQRYPELYGSDDRLQACMAEIGVPLTKHPGFHQFDVYGSVTGVLAAHPVAPLVSMHHLDIIDPIFPNKTRVQALQQLISLPIKLDSAGLMQQSICYDRRKMWTVSSSWGYAVQIYRGYISPRELERPARTFLSWYRTNDDISFSFNTRPVSWNPCQKPFTYYLSKAWYDPSKKMTVSEYVRHWDGSLKCMWKISDPGAVNQVVVYKRPDTHLWDKAPRRNCCRILPSKEKGRMILDVGVCREGEIGEI